MTLQSTPHAAATSNHDAIVIGSGATGSLAAYLLTKAGLRTLVLDAGAELSFRQAPLRKSLLLAIERVADPRLLRVLPWGVLSRGRAVLKAIGARRQPVQSGCFAWEGAPRVFVDDIDNPYTCAPGSQFVWYRARAAGGRMIVPGHGRQYYRLGQGDLAPADGLSPAWPVPLDELDLAYAEVERLIELKGRNDDLACVPDSVITDVIAPSGAEQALMTRLTARWPGLQPIIGRFAAPPPLTLLPAAQATGLLSFRPGAAVHEVLVDGQGAVSGVSWTDRQTGTHQTGAPLVFGCASTLETTRILMLSRDRHGMPGLGQRSGVLGRNLMDHIMVKAEGIGGALEGSHEHDSRGRCVYIPRFDRGEAAPDGGRGFGMQIYESPATKGRSHFTAVAFGEMLPRAENRVEIDPDRRDRWGIPTLRIACSHDTRDKAVAARMAKAITEVAQTCGVRLSAFTGEAAPPGAAIHECGTARMGDDPDSSVLDCWNECWDASGLFVTDGAAFPSQGSQNPTLTMMALTARAVRRAVERGPRR